ncbi:GNAT family N-acetyltransferase [Gottfriedia sp. NPDC057991]|uniref:GNAT family N-acetyltransferase n=1 Tax=Gottfriedia sp. NPDC057991 TaxID=3346298 RepID=UPI0036DA36AF
MIKLNNKEYKNIFPLIISINYTPTFVYSVLQEIVDGDVFVDHIETPKSIFIGTKSGFYCVIGETSNISFNYWLKEFYIDRVEEKELPFILYSSSGSWNQLINDLLNNKLTKLDRYSFTFKFKEEILDNYELPQDYSLKKIDENVLQSNVGFKPIYYKHYWDSVSNYLENGFGICVLHKEVSVCECTSVFANELFSEIDIATKEEYRGKGFAFIAAKMYIQDCINKGLAPRWECDIDNFGSIRLAEKLGFEEPIHYAVYFKE